MSLDHVQLLLADVAIIIIVARLPGIAARRLGQPPVLGEILAGILLGPTFFHGRVTTTLFPPALIPPLTALADIGLVLFMFAVGYEVDLRLIRGREQAAFSVSIGSVALPLGSARGWACGWPIATTCTTFPPSRCSSGPRWRLPRSRSWRASSPTGACTAPASAGWRWPAPR